jgi:hypothetical protein
MGGGGFVHCGIPPESRVKVWWGSQSVRRRRRRKRRRSISRV